MEDLARIIRLPADISVIESATKVDVTERTLFKVMADLERCKRLTTVEFLAELIRLQAQGPQPLLRAFLEESMRFLIEETKA
jgi:polyhydroxyalkanoate synthesis regulator protein